MHDKINQDRGCVVYPYRSSDDEALFMVLDGHGEQGDRISEFVMRQVTRLPIGVHVEMCQSFYCVPVRIETSVCTTRFAYA